MRGALLAFGVWLVLAPVTVQAGVVIIQELPQLHQTQTLTYEGVRSREDLSSGYYSLTLPDENRTVEVFPASKSFEEKPLSAAMGELASLQRAVVARDVRLLDESIRVAKGHGDRVAGMKCAHYRFTWQARVSTPEGVRNYGISMDECISHAPEALAARKASLEHMKAVAGRFGETVDPEKGNAWLFDIGRLLLGVSAGKLIAEEARIGGFPLFKDIEVDFGGMALEPMMRGAFRQQAEADGEPVDDSELDAEMRDIQKEMARMNSSEFQAEMKESMQELEDPEVQAQLQKFLTPEQLRTMRQGMADVASGNGPTASLAEGKVRSQVVVKSIQVKNVAPDTMRLPLGFSWKKPVFQIPENRTQDERDGDGALEPEAIGRLMLEAERGVRPKGVDQYYTPVSRDARPWMRFYKEWEGVPYLWGGTTKRGVDCSGLTQNAYRAVPGIQIPRTTVGQISIGRRVSLMNARAGDLIFFDTGFRHVGVWVGQNKFFHASSSKGVTVSTLSNAYWSHAFRFIRRVNR